MKFMEIVKSPAVTAPVLIIFVIAAMYASRYALQNLGSETNLFVALGMIQLAAIALPGIIYYLIKGRKLSSPMMLLSRSGTNVFFVLFAALFFVFGTLLIKFVYFVSGETVTSLVNYYGDFSSTVESAGQAEIIVSMIIIPAVCEEFLFRGIIMSEYRQYGTANAVIISAICFAVMHFSLKNFVIYLFAGLVLGFVSAVTRSLIPSIAIHILSNTLSIYASDAFLRVTVVKNGAYFIGFLLISLTALAFILMMSRVESICYKYAEKPPVESIPARSYENVWKVFLSPTFLALAAAFIAINI